MDPSIEKVDPAVAALIAKDVERQRTHVQLIASENFVSRAVMQASGSVLTNKYSEGYPGKRYYEGCETIDEVESLAADRATALFGAEHANVQSHSGAQANMGAYFGLLKPGDKVLGMRLDQGAISPTARRSTSPGCSTTSLPTGSTPRPRWSTWQRSPKWPAASVPA